MKKRAIFMTIMLVLTMVPVLVLGGAVSADDDGDSCVLGVTKTLTCWADLGDRDGIIEVGEVWVFGLMIQVTNSSTEPIYDVIVEDRFGAELMLYPGSVFPLLITAGSADIDYQGNSDKMFLTWNVGYLGPGVTATLKFDVQTDINPGGNQEYTSCDCYCLNSGPVAKGSVAWTDPSGRVRYQQVSAEAAPIYITVPGPVPSIP
jgi:hypothetical protein